MLDEKAMLRERQHLVSSIRHSPQLSFQLQYSRARSSPRVNYCPPSKGLGNEKDLSRVRIFYFRARWKPFDVHVFARRERTFHHVRLPGDRNPVGMVTLCRLGRGCRRSRRRCCFCGRRGLCGGRRRVRIERLLLRRIFLLFCRILGGLLTNAGRRLVHLITR